MTIGSRIKARRMELGLSVDTVAEKLNKNRATIYRYESNDIDNLPITVLEPLAEVLQTTPAFLMGWEEGTTNNQTHETPQAPKVMVLTRAMEKMEPADQEKLLEMAKILFPEKFRNDG